MRLFAHSRKRTLSFEECESRRLLANDLGNLLVIGDSISESYDSEGKAPNPDTGVFAAQYGIPYELFKNLVDADYDGQFIGKTRSVLENRYRDCYFELGRICTATEQLTYNYGNRLYPGQQAIDNIAPNVGTVVGEYPIFPPHNGQDFFNDWTSYHFAVGGTTARKLLDTQGFAAYLNTSQAPFLQPSPNADIALIHLETNGSQPVSQKVNDLQEMVGLLQAHNQNITVFLAQIIPKTDNKIRAQQINAEIATRTWSTATSEVILVDQYSSFVDANGNVLVNLYTDNTHPNNEGQRIMAQNLYHAIDTWYRATHAPVGDTTTGLVSHWTFDNSVDQVIPDVAPYGQPDNVALSGSAFIESLGGGGGVLRLVDANSTLTVPDSYDINRGTHTDLTVAFWFQAESLATTRKQIIYEQGGSMRGLNIYVDGGRLYGGAWNRSAAESNWSGSWIDASIQPGIWHHVALTLSGGPTVQPGALSLWLDGVKINDASGSQLWNHAGNGVAIGGVKQGTRFHDSTPTNVPTWFAGRLDDFRFYNRPLADADIRTLTTLGIGGGIQSAVAQNDTTNRPSAQQYKPYLNSTDNDMVEADRSIGLIAAAVETPDRANTNDDKRLSRR